MNLYTCSSTVILKPFYFFIWCLLNFQNVTHFCKSVSLKKDCFVYYSLNYVHVALFPPWDLPGALHMSLLLLNLSAHDKLKDATCS